MQPNAENVHQNMASRILETLSRGGVAISSVDEYKLVLARKKKSSLFNQLEKMGKGFDSLKSLWNSNELFHLANFVQFFNGAHEYTHPHAVNRELNMIDSIDRGSMVFEQIFKSDRTDMKELRKKFASVRRLLNPDK